MTITSEFHNLEYLNSKSHKNIISKFVSFTRKICDIFYFFCNAMLVLINDNNYYDIYIVLKDKI